MSRKIRSAEEEDVFTSWRRLYCWTQRLDAAGRGV